MRIRESQIEDILATYPDLVKEILEISGDLVLISRQKILPSGNRIDLIFLTARKILLIELKIEDFKCAYLNQIVDYASELETLQRKNQFISGELKKYLICPDFKEHDTEICYEKSVNLIRYSPSRILEEFYVRLKVLASFITIKPSNHGLWNIHLLNRILYILEEPKRNKSISEATGLSKSTIGSYLRLAQELMLVSNNNDTWSLTEFGEKYFMNRDMNAPIEFLSEEQTRTLQNIIIQNPFSSGAIIGLYTIIEVLFNLAKNTYPVPENLLKESFRQASGMYYEWNTDKTITDSMRMYSNYAIDIGLMGRVADKFYITPDGIRFILLLNLHKAIKIVDALGISKTEK